MHIYATKKVMQAFKKAEKMTSGTIENMTILEESDSPEEQALFEWHINSVKVNQEDLLIVTHDLSGLTLLIVNADTEDLLDFYEWFEEALYDLLGKLGFSHKSIQQYLTYSKGRQLTLGKATDFKKIGRNSSAVSLLRQLDYYQENEYMVQSYWQYQTSRLNRSLKQASQPFTQFINEYEKVIGPVSFNVNMAEIEVRLKMGDLPDVIRVIQMPMQLTFEDLHRVIQKVFMWQDAHLHQFIMEDGATVISAEQKRSMERYQMESQAEASAASQLKLADVITPEENGIFTYVYDFGDSWEHRIRVRRFYSENRRMFPKLSLMSGEPVPENVGGPPGYADFLEVINDPTHDEHSVIKEWANDYFTRLNLFNDVNNFNHDLTVMHS
ncbi:pRiA4b ORF-3-like protein [Alkalibacterium subtropicum]|uniref:PRiA4b ORF-3-like protein n=1 Tax=Alkalibacterium subtropicum TaxID=753702 RepID=A0A1I1K9T1_9LACT|nr:plasmid pRiA4b ORF-3 family protein [Alkalibacterium subtropicum]SFC57281.1 pRiA4b ORF-3-like protein [Alkalibacterium subtropicum]